VSSNRADGEMYSIQHYVIKFVSDLRQVCGFLRKLRLPLLPITNEVVVSVRVLLESNQTLIRHIIISFIHITEMGSVRDRAMVLNATY
jgi:hypothetical protein